MGIKLISEISESNFKLADAAAIELSILARMDSLFYYIKDSDDQLVSFKHFEIDATESKNSYHASLIKDWLANDPWLAYSFKKVKFASGNRIYNLLPKRLFNLKDARSVLEQMTTQVVVDIGIDHLNELNIVASYHLNGQSNALFQKFKHAEQFHLASPLILGCQKLAKLKKEHTVFAHFHQQQIQLCVFDRDNLVFYNSFEFQTARDSLYFILLAYEQLGISPAEIPLHLSGQIIADSEIYNLLFRYINELKFVPRTSLIKHGTKFDQLTPHFYFDLFSLEQC